MSDKAMSEHLTSKTLKQIKGKKHALATTAQRARPPVKEKSVTEQTATPNQGLQQGPSNEDRKAAINLEGGPLVGESAEVLLRLVEGKDSESCYASLLDKTAQLFASPVRKGGSKKRQGWLVADRSVNGLAIRPICTESISKNIVKTGR